MALSQNLKTPCAQRLEQFPIGGAGLLASRKFAF